MRSAEHVIGEAEVLKIFKLTGTRKSIAAGCRVKEGFLDNSSPGYLWKVIRDTKLFIKVGLSFHSKKLYFHLCRNVLHEEFT